MPPRKPRLASISGSLRAPRAAGVVRGDTPSRAPRIASLGPFGAECDAAIESLRRAIRSLAAEASSEPLRPQEVARTFGINKNLTWKIARILLATDSFEAIAMLPGPEGIEIYLRAFEAAGLTRTQTDPVREAIRRFDTVVERHFGDRAQLDLVLDGLRSDGNLESSRRMAFRGMSGVFGLQVRLRLTAQLIYPTAGAPGKADIAQIVGISGLQRLRPIGALPIFRTTTASAAPGQRTLPLFSSGDGGDREYLFREFSSHPNATVSAHDHAGRTVVELSEGPLGRIGESELFFGTLIKGTMNTRRVPGDASNDFVSNVSIPSELLVLDFYCHRSLEGTDAMRVTVHSTLGQPLATEDAQREQTVLPIETAPVLFERIDELPSIPALPKYPKLIERAFRETGQDIGEFRLMRVALEFPPAPSAVLVKWTLPG